MFATLRLFGFCEADPQRLTHSFFEDAATSRTGSGTAAKDASSNPSIVPKECFNKILLN
jgi:hypothetical protein